jgi:hypothetical protein
MWFLILPVQVSWLLPDSYLVGGVKLGLDGALACTGYIDMILYRMKISILIVIADPGIFIRIIRTYLCTINSIAGIAT